MRTLFIIFILTINLAIGQTIEQKALTHLADNIYGQELTNSEENFKVTKDSTRIWFYPSVYGTKSKLKLKNGIWSSEDKFYKIIHSNKDIFVTTKKAMTEDGLLFVPFDITTLYGHHFTYKVTFEGDNPIDLTRTAN